MFAEPYFTVPEAAEMIGMTYQSANRAVEQLVDDGVLVEITGNDQNRVFRADELMDIVERSPSGLPTPTEVIESDTTFRVHDL